MFYEVYEIKFARLAFLKSFHQQAAALVYQRVI